MRHLSRFLAITVLLLISPNIFAQSTSCNNTYNPLTNCSFETGDFSGWIIQDIAVPFLAANVTGAGFSAGFGFFSTVPTDGSFVSVNGFDGGGPDTIEYSQDVTLPANAGVLTFDYRAGWDMLNFPGSTAARIFSVEIQPSGGGAALASQVFLTANPGENIPDTGALSSNLSLSQFAGQSIRVTFIWTIPEDFTGPAQFQLDNVNMIPLIPVPTLSVSGLVGLALLMLLIAYFGINRRIGINRSF